MGYMISLVGNLSGVGVFGISLVAFIAGVFAGRWFEKDKCNKEKEALNNANKTTSNAFFNDHKTELCNLKNDHKAEISALKLSNDARIATLESECKEKIETLKNDHKAEISALKLSNDARMATLESECKEKIETLKKSAVAIEEFDLVCKTREEKHRIDTAIANERGIFVAIGAPKIKTRFKDGIPYFCDCKLFDFMGGKKCTFSNSGCIIFSSKS